jgi:hypothetical protein
LLVAGGLHTTGFVVPAFLEERSGFRGGILGEWMVQGGTLEIKSDEKSGQVTSERGAQDRTYDVTMPDIEEDGATLASIGRLVRLGSYLFIDMTSPDLERRKNAIVPYRAIESHVCGRVQLEKDK